MEETENLENCSRWDKTGSQVWMSPYNMLPSDFLKDGPEIAHFPD